MSLRQEFFDGIEEIYTELDDLVLCASYERVEGSSYVAGGQVSNRKKKLSIRIMEDTSVENINGQNVSNFDKVFLIPAVDLCDISPSINDQIVTADGVVYNVDQHSTDPSKTSYLVGVKK